MGTSRAGAVVLMGLLGLALNVAGCGSSAKLMSGLSIEEFKPVPGILASAKLVKGTIRGITGDRVEVETGERAPRYLSLEAGGRRRPWAAGRTGRRNHGE